MFENEVAHTKDDECGVVFSSLDYSSHGGTRKKEKMLVRKLNYASCLSLRAREGNVFTYIHDEKYVWMYYRSWFLSTQNP